MEGLKLEAEVANGTTTATYRWGMQLIGESRGGANKTILQDRFRSPLILLDQTGGISDRVRYTAAGEIRQRVGSSPLAFGYGGYLTQSGTDELYAFARTYSPGMARFNENDPVRSFDPMLSMGPHRYVLGYGNPLSYVDPDGRIGIFNDGTWNNRYDPEQISDDRLTNVAKLMDIYAGSQRVYQVGIGTNRVSQYICGITGCGFNARVNAAYQAIVNVYNDPNATEEDRMIDMFGFSRGAAQTRALHNKLVKEGIPVKHKSQIWEPSFNGTTGGNWVTKTTVERVEAKVRYIGLFDSVSALGVPTDPQSVYHSLYAGYGQELDLSKAGAIRHAMAANEARTGFDLVSIKACSACKLPGNANEDFFVGAHADIGRGYGISEGGSAAALYPLAYIYKGAREAGVPLRKDSRLESAWDEWQNNFGSTLEQTNDSRYILERLMDREERTVYYNSGSETLSFNEMRDRAFRSSTQGWRTVEEDEKKVDAATVFKEKP